MFSRAFAINNAPLSDFCLYQKLNFIERAWTNSVSCSAIFEKVQKKVRGKKVSK